MTLTLTILAILAVTILVPPVRRYVWSGWMMVIASRQLPTIGDTERIALEAGSVWWEGDLFSGKPDWNKLNQFKIQPLSAEEKAFMEGPVEKLCSMLNDFEIAQNRDLSKDVWAFIKKHKFFGMIIPKEYGGLGFSAAAHSAVVTRISSASFTTAVVVMVPNSLGPGELLLRYGTRDQQKYYLPRLAIGQEIPCFGLTEPHAGSDAANGSSFGTVCYGNVKGKKTLGIKLTFNKRYITLAPVATVIGLAFRLHDPDHLLGNKTSNTDLGITLALIPRATKGLVIGNKHDPLGAPFPNGPMSGKDVFIPMEYIIGGTAQIGNGWRMLMECLAAGRGISLPSVSVGAAELVSRATSAYGIVREQFGLPIGKFEGVRERLARIATLTYTMNATRLLTAGAVDSGEHPSVASAIAKAYLTEGMRTTLNDAMDIMGGAAICRGPKNIFARAYACIPIAITVEGANILTRSLIVFGQGAMRCHPYMQRLVAAIQSRKLTDFDYAIWGHLFHVARNKFRSLFHGLTGGILIPVPYSPYRRHMQRLSRLSAAFAYLADIGLLSLGGAFKRKEYLSGRYADAFAHLYLASAVLKHAHDEAKHNPGLAATQRPLVEWSLQNAEYQIEQALLGVLDNLPSRILAWGASRVVFPYGARRRPPCDKLTDAVVDAFLEHASGIRESLSADIYVPAASNPGMGQLEDAYLQTIYTNNTRKKLVQAAKAGHLRSRRPDDMLAEATEIGLIDTYEAKALFQARMAADTAIQVDAFTPSDHADLK